MIKSFVGQRIRLMRNRAGYSQEAFAKVCGLDRTYIAGVELGRRNISIENLNRIAEALDLTLAELCDASVPAHRTILLKICGQMFVLESKEELTPDIKEHIETICRCAYDDDSEFAEQLECDSIEGPLCDLSPFDIADLFVRIVKAKIGIDVVFKGIDLEVSITD